MRACYFEQHGGLEVIQVGEVPDPVLEPGEVLIRVHAAAANYNDIWARQGLEHVDVPLPHICGTEASGTVVEVADDVDTVQVGDEVVTYPIRSCRRCDACVGGQEVFCRHMRIWGFQTGPYDGAYAELAKVQAEQVQPKAPHLSWEDAAALSSILLVSWRMLVTRAKVQPGETVLIFGASGGSGSVAVQLVRALGAVPIAVTSSDAKEAFVRKMGAEHVIRSDQQRVDKAARAISRGGVDVVFDHVGVDTWRTAVNALRWGGRLTICGATTGYDAKLDLRVLWNKQLSLLGSHVGTHAEWVASNRLIHAGRIQSNVTEVVGLEDLADVQRRMLDRATMGKIVAALG